MTKILGGYAQPDIEATKGDETILVFVETPESLVENALALKKTMDLLRKRKVQPRVDLVVTKPRGKEGE